MKIFLEIMAYFLIVYVLFLGMFCIYGVNKINLNKERIIYYILYVLISVCSFYFLNNYIKMIVSFVFIVIFCKRLLRISIKDSVIICIICESVAIISEAFFSIFIIYLLKIELYDFANIYAGSFIPNIIISIIMFLMFKYINLNKLYLFIKKSITKIKDEYVVLLMLFIILIINIIEASSYYMLKPYYLILFNVILILIYTCIIIYSLIVKNKYNIVYNKYNTTINSLKEYESILENYRLMNHENKNQLLTIRSMLNSKNKEALKYIDNITNNKIKDNDEVFKEIMVIPSGGLRGLIYSKILIMKKNKINYNIYLSKEIETSKLIKKLSDQNILDLSKILGVFFDNAIEEVTTVKNGKISIQIYCEEKYLCFSISNNYKNLIDISSINKAGYSTKGKNRGYGLSLVKKIVESNLNLKQCSLIDSDIFTQIIKILID